MTTVTDLYTQVLGRQPDAGGLDYWTGVFGSDVSPAELATFMGAAKAELANRTPEEQQVLAPKLLDDMLAEANKVTTTSSSSTPAAPTSYLDQLKSKLTPEQYQALVAPLMFSANDSFGGQLQDYQAQLVTPLDTSKVNAPKKLESGTNASPQYDSEGNITGFSLSTPTVVNGIPVYAQYDDKGNLTGYQGDQTYRTWLNGQQSLGGAWDASGKATPKQYQSSSGGVFSGLASGISDFLSSDIGKLALLAGGAYAGGLFDPVTAAAAGGENVAGSTLLDYSAPTSTGGLGLKGSAALDGALSSGLAAPASGSLGGGLGLTVSEAANLAAMGGGQGLLANAAGGGVLGETGVNTGLLTTSNLYPNTVISYTAPETVTAPTEPTTTATTSTNLSPTQIANLAKTGLTAAGLLGGAKAVSNLTGGNTGTLSLNPQNRAGIFSGSANYSPEYYQAIQSKYNQLMPNQPRDVTTELKNWYETKFAPKVA